MVDAYQLRELHDTYVWEVNAAIGEDRIDLVWQLADDYMDRALQLISAGESPACDVPDCTICARSQAPRPVRRPRRWFRSAG